MFPTGLRFGAQGTSGADAATITTAGALDNLDPWSVVVWFRIRSLNGSGAIVSKGQGSSNNRRVVLTYTNTGRLNIPIDRAITDLSYQTPDGTLKAGQSYAAVVTFNSANSAGDLARFYLRSAGGGPPYAVNRATATDGTGSFQSDAGVNLVWGNNTAGLLVGQIDLYAGLLSNKELTAAEAQATLTGPWNPVAVRGLVGAWEFGRGGATAWDRSGNGRHAAVTIAVPLMRSWASPRKRWAQIATAAAGGGPFPWFVDTPLHGGMGDAFGGVV